jgi:hypothetical protein
MLSFVSVEAQSLMTPELLWKLGRLSPMGISIDGKNIIYKVSTPSVAENKSNSKYYSIPVSGGIAIEITDYKTLLKDKNVSPDGANLLYTDEVKIDKVHGKDFYPELDKSNVQVYNGLDYRHWDTWNEGKFNHVFYKENKEGAVATDIMKGESFDAPQKPFGGDEDYIGRLMAKAFFMFAKNKPEPLMQFLPIPIFISLI